MRLTIPQLWQARWRAAARRPASLWILAVALAAGAAVADLVLILLPATGRDLDEARALGIVSQSVLQGYPKSADARGYVVGVALALIVSLSLWLLWAGRAGRRALDRSGAVRQNEESPLTGDPGSLPWRHAEWAVVAVAIVAVLRFDLARNGYTSTWVLFSEEGEMMAWVDTLLRGKALSRDVFCLYGPLSIYPIALLFRCFGASVRLWRLWIFALDIPALLVVYAVFRDLLRRRIAAFAATSIVALCCLMWLPAMSWSLSRVGLGVAAIGCAYAFVGRGRRFWLAACGALLGLALGFSQEVGLTAGLGIGAALVVDAWMRSIGPGRRARDLGFAALGCAAIVVPLALFLGIQGTLGVTIQNLFLIFPRLKLLGFGGVRFPSLNADLAAFLSSPSAMSWSGLLISLQAWFIPSIFVVSAFRQCLQIALGRWSSRTFAELALTIFGLAIFQSAVSRPDDPHLKFCLLPALILLGSVVERCAAVALSRAAPIPWRSAAAVFLTVAIAGIATVSDRALGNARMLVRQAGLTLSGQFSHDAVPGLQPLSSPRAGGIAIPQEVADHLEAAIRYIQKRTRADEPIWCYPNEAMINFLADRPLANSFPLGLFAITRGQRLEAIAELEVTRPNYAIVYLNALWVDDIAYEKALPELHEYLELHYVQERAFGPFAVGRRRPGGGG